MFNNTILKSIQHLHTPAACLFSAEPTTLKSYFFVNKRFSVGESWQYTLLKNISVLSLFLQRTEVRVTFKVTKFWETFLIKYKPLSTSLENKSFTTSWTSSLTVKYCLEHTIALSASSLDPSCRTEKGWSFQPWRFVGRLSILDVFGSPRYTSEGYHVVKYTAQKIPADLVTFAGEILNGKLHFLCSY